MVFRTTVAQVNVDTTMTKTDNVGDKEDLESNWGHQRAKVATPRSLSSQGMYLSQEMDVCSF